MLAPDDHPHQGDVDVERPEEWVHPHHDLLGHGVYSAGAATKLDEEPGVHHQDKLDKSG